MAIPQPTPNLHASCWIELNSLWDSKREATYKQLKKTRMPEVDVLILYKNKDKIVDSKKWNKTELEMRLA